MENFQSGFKVLKSPSENGTSCDESLFSSYEISILTQEGQIKRIEASFEGRFHDVILQCFPAIKLLPQLREDGQHCYYLSVFVLPTE